MIVPGVRIGDTAGYHRLCIASARTQGDSWCGSYAKWGFGIAIWRSGDPDRGIEVTREALALKSGMSDTLGSALCLESLAWMETTRGRHERAAGAARRGGRTVGAEKRSAGTS